VVQSFRLTKWFGISKQLSALTEPLRLQRAQTDNWGYHPIQNQGENMTKAEFVAKVAEKAVLKKSDAEKAVNAFLETVTETLKAGDKVVFTGFGSFEVTERAAREGRNPSTGEKMQISATKTPKFKAGKGLKDAVA
jgi:DNA-binding protein HU-beta